MELCPRCQQVLPDPPPRFCPQCGQETPGRETPVPEAGPAWEHRDQVGVLNAFVETTKDVLTSPRTFFRTLPPSAGLVPPMSYGVIVTYVGFLCSSFYEFVFQKVRGPVTMDGQ